MTRDDVQRWLDRYVLAWQGNEAEAIGDLFAADAVYRYLPYDHPTAEVRGRDAIVSSWLEEPDAPGTWQASYSPWAVDGDRAVAVGWSRYEPTETEPARTFHNVFLLRFDADGRCVEFQELYMLEKTTEYTHSSY